MQIANDTVVSFHYTLTDDTGTTLDSSSGDEPLTYLHGSGSIITGLERELEGREAGDSFNAAIAPSDGYGDVNKELVMEIPLDSLSHIEGLEPGMQLRSQGQDGREQMLLVEAIGQQRHQQVNGRLLGCSIVH